MNRKNLLLTCIVAALLATPAATAVWSAHGSYEPDTAQDKTQGFMWPTNDARPDATALRVYFNAFMSEWFTGVTANSGIIGSRIVAAPVQTPSAYLGIWKDCNQDGYIGVADGALADYSALLLTSAAVCPDGGDFNRDGWVYEFQWVGPDDVEADGFRTYPAVVNDTAAKVWAHPGLPGPGPGGSCVINPQPRGTYASTGGLIAYLECGTTNGQIGSTSRALDPDGELGIAFEEGEQEQSSDSLLNQPLVNLFGNPYADGGHEDGLVEKDRGNHDVGEAFSAWDCDAEPTLALTDPTGGELPTEVADPTDGEVSDGPISLTDGEGRYALVPAVSTAPLREGRSVFEGANMTADRCEESGDNRIFGDDDDLPEPSNEADVGGTSQNAAIRHHDIQYSFSNSIGLGVGGLDEDGVIPRTIPEDAGVGAGRFFLYGAGGPSWSAVPNYVTEPQLVRSDNFQAADAFYVTSYAKVGTVTLSMAQASPGGQAGVFGSEWCIGATSGVVNGFDCDASHWWDVTTYPGTDAMPVQSGGQVTGVCATHTAPVDNCREMGAFVGEAYHLRDIDCYDGQVTRAAPAVRASLVDLAAGPCSS